MNLTESLLLALKARGATEIFGIPGDFALPLFEQFERLALLPLHTLSHEPAVGFAADAAARSRGGLGVAAVTYGAGAFNLVNAVAGAYAERVPLVVLSGAPAAHEATSGFLLHHQVKTLDSQWRVFEELTVDRARLDDPASAPALIARVLDAALSRSRPVYLEIPRDMPARPCAAAPVLAPAAIDPDRLAACADELLARLAAAERPLLMVGVEVRRYGLEPRVAELARRLAMPVVTSFMGRGLLAEADLPLVGTYIGLAGDPAVSAQVESSDGLFLLGVIVSDTNFAVSSRRIDLRHAIQVFDGDVSMGHHVYHGLPIAALVDALLARVPSRGLQPPAPKAAAAASRVAPPAAGDLSGPDRPVLPQDIAAAVNALFRDHGPMPLASDVGDCLFTAMDIEQTELLAPGYYATMGYGVPAGLGLQVATGRRPVVLVGDGAFQMTGWELGNAARCGCDPIVLVFNNASWEMLRTFAPGAQFNDLGRWDFAAMAAGMGGDGYRVHTTAGLAAALAKAQATRGRFQLLDIQLQPGELSPTLQRFVQAVKRLSMPD
ncbi:MAG: indolepyruvate/phenylpyruvate decarboxylase [Rubrivivax sp.]|jgi:indolepyruvate decarboxylase|nr:indolepyruvate/phenylpyruvate decarboxylase [Betaproteobacteria bacterium]MBP6316966.1 indolepyruvate/phenylpyruvate decarboxylase [Rubrivivax sp.]MBK7277484.1 indolepyruvate/phenylpyruvate decarboxylase [Betaproteobacteria bacterium]MBK7460249.1 indolepyruvate/phenylpyruvate decarboxylase [Betaproteobacteria bacterium]MBK7516165.1 indolepyruvate/phenylpyruvate decarboxylase [Betaproteobacteria bacterium]